MRGLRMMVAAMVCAGGMVAAHGQIGGDEPGGHPETSAPPAVTAPRVVRISSGVMQGLLLTKVDPVYPADAREQHIQGAVTLHAIIGKDGLIEKLEVISGPTALKDAALGAVRQWVYKPYLLNGEPTKVDTTIIVNFNLEFR
jgi:periplasmic protein TonB